MKNWLPPEWGWPVFAIAMVPLMLECPLPNSSSIVYPGPPIPVPVGSPPWIMNPSMTLWKMVPL